MPAPSKHTPAPPPALEVPRSASSFLLNLLGFAGGLGVIMALIAWGPLLDAWIGPLPWGMGTVASNSLLVAMIGCVVVFLIIGAGELFVFRSYRNASTGLAQTLQRPPNFGRIAVRLVGFAVTLGLIAVAYWLFPEYHGSFYNPFWAFIEAVACVLALSVIPYFIWTDMRLLDPHDAYWHLGRKPWTMFQPGADGDMVRSHLMGWTVKAFFLPLMANYLQGEVHSLSSSYATLYTAAPNVYQFLYEMSYMVDLLFCVVGYTITLRLFDSHIRSTEPTAFGWLIALVCYQPFYSTIGSMYLRYDDNLYWDNWLASLTGWQRLNDGLHWMWAGMICTLLFIYALATVSFGLRFSNLTYRGVITSGPYRFSKHPAYISKNLSWWLISIPFISYDHWYEAIRNSVLLGLLNLIYFLRARTEENHLSLRDPDYVAYALWMEEHGMLAGLGRLLPFLRYKPPAGAAGTAAARN